MRRSNCSAPIPPPVTPQDITFLVAATVSLSLYFPLAPLYVNTIITLFSSASPLFITHIFRLTPGLPLGGWGQNTLTGALCNFSLARPCKLDQTKLNQHDIRTKVLQGDINIDNITLDFNKKSSPWKQDSIAVLNPKHSPIPNSGEQSVPSNYQGIAPTSLFAKVVNKMILMTFTDFSKAFDNIGHYTMLKTHKA